jgi:hypothetical protein
MGILREKTGTFQEALPVTQADRQQKKGGFPSNRIRPTTKNTPFPLPAAHTNATAHDVRDLSCAERKGGGKSDPWGRLLVQECDSLLEHRAPYFLQSPGKTACGGVHGAQEFSMHSNKVRLLFASLS